MEKQNHLFSNEDHDNNTMLSNFGIEFPNCYFHPSWDHYADQSDPFESAISSMVSSPATTVAAGDGMVLRELIGRLGSICSSHDIDRSPLSYSTNTSCYTTPLNSPPKLSLGEQARSRRSLNSFQAPSGPALAALSANPEFADRAARYSCLGGQGQDHQDRRLSRCSSPDNSSVSEQIPNENARKRKLVSRGKGKDTTLPSPAKTDPKVSKEIDESNAKKRKQNEDEKNNKSGPKATTPDEPPKDYIHVRARRGQATDSHSLAERVRREKIGERMKFLQDLVPGCNKVIGKAVMLDEIINYVQSLQRQVEFLSMKLATVNPRMEFNAEALLLKDIYQSRGSIPQNLYPLDTTFPYGYQSAQGPFSMPPLNSALHRSTNMQFPRVDRFSESASQSSALWEDDLHTVVQMGFGQNQMQNIHNGRISSISTKLHDYKSIIVCG